MIKPSFFKAYKKRKDRLKRWARIFRGSEVCSAILIKIKTKPVCAWIVCIKGPRYGKDYRVVFGKNYIGRTDAMDIQIIGDNAIKQENHAILSFDEKDLEATLICTEGGGITYLNGKAVYTPQVLETYDVITMGESEFLYIALCGKQFSW